MRNDYYETYLSYLLATLRSKMASKRTSTLEEFIILPLEKNNYKFVQNEYTIKVKILEDLYMFKEIDKSLLDYYTYMASIIYANYTNLGKKLTIEKIMGTDVNNNLEIELNNPKLFGRYQEFEKKLDNAIISIYRQYRPVEKNVSNEAVLKYYTLDLNDEYFSNMELLSIKNAIEKNDFNNLNIIIDNDRKGRKFN